MSELAIKTREIELERARTTYAKRHRYVHGFRATLSTKDVYLTELKERYQIARTTYLQAIAEVYGPERAVKADKSEKWALRLAKLEKWEKIAGIVFGGVATGTAIGAIGVGTLAAGVAGSLFGRYIAIPLIGMVPVWGNPFRNFHDDSHQVKSAREELARRWQEAQKEPGMTYEKFCKRERVHIKRLSRQMVIDKVFRAGAVSAFGFTAFGITGGRNFASHYLAEQVDGFLGVDGETIMFGDRPIQRLTHFLFGNLVGLIHDMFHINAAAAAETVDPMVADRARDFHWPDETVDAAGLDALEAKLPRYIAWAETILEEYKRTLDMRDPSCVRVVQQLENSIKIMKDVYNDLSTNRANGIRSIERIPGDPTQGQHRANVRTMYAKNTNLFRLRDSFVSLLAGARTIETIGNGQVWVTGAVQNIKDFFKAIGVEFKYLDHWNLKPRTARMFMEIYRDISDDPRLRDGGLRITEGGGAQDQTIKHSPKGGHRSGDAFDMTPRGGVEGGYFTKEYVATMFAKMYENSLIAARDPRIIKYFEMKIDEYAASRNTQMRDYYIKRLAWARNPYSTQYYTFYYEPSTNGPVGAKEEVVKVLMKEFGMTEAQAKAYFDVNSGDTANTTAAHFHIWAPEDIRKTPPPVFAAMPMGSGPTKTATVED
ncbi:MAG: hypothetical protein RLZZ283_62 [Candidatus Parcubacteria bacterium]|jgi:hypothetical protein